MKHVSSIFVFQCLSCWLAPCMVESYTLNNPFRIHYFQTRQSAFTPSHITTTAASTSSTTAAPSSTNSRTTSLQMAYGKYGDGRSSSRYASQNERTKRQERVGHVVRSELATILKLGHSIKNDDDPIEDELRRRINIVHADVSPDLRQARVTVSVMGTQDRKQDIIAKRRAYAWLVRSTKSIRHSLAQKMKHMKASPDLTFVQVDVGAAVDVMQLIEKVSKGYKRNDVLEMDFEDDEDEDGEDGWIDEDEEDGDEMDEGEDDEDFDDDDWVDIEDGIYVDVK